MASSVIPTFVEGSLQEGIFEKMPSTSNAFFVSLESLLNMPNNAFTKMILINTLFVKTVEGWYVNQMGQKMREHCFI